MSQRNPMNERYTTDEHKGQTRKSAATAKPKTKAASSVRIQSTEKTPQQKKAEAKARKQKRRATEAKYYNPPTERYKKLRRVWWVCLIVAIVCTVLSWVVSSNQWGGDWTGMVVLVAAYVFIIAAFYVDFSLIRKERRRYQEEMEQGKSKEARAAQREAKAAERAAVAAAKAEAEAKAAGSAQEAPKKKGLFGRFKKDDEAKADQPEAVEAKASEAAAPAKAVEAE